MKDLINNYCDEHELDNVLFIDGHDNAIMGLSTCFNSVKVVYSYKKIIGNWGYPVPNALKNKTAIISMTYGGPSFFVSAIIQQIPRRIKKMVFNGLCGMKVKYLRFYEVLPNMPKEIFEKHMEKVRETVQQL